MPRVRIDPDAITQIAVAIVDDLGLEELSLTAVAEKLGVGPSALYSHVDGLEGLRQRVAAQAMANLLNRVRNAAIGVAGTDAVVSVSTAYRQFATEHPGQFRSTVMPPGAGQSRDASKLASTEDEVLNVFALVYQGSGMKSDRCRLAARTTHTALHGFVTLEVRRGPSRNQDDEFRELLDFVTGGLTS